MKSKRITLTEKKLDEMIQKAYENGYEACLRMYQIDGKYEDN